MVIISVKDKLLTLTTCRTSRSIFDDLQQACSNLRSFSNMNLRMQYSEYVAWTQSCNLASALHFWRSRYSFFKQVDLNFGPPKFSTMSDAQASCTLHFPMQEARPNISLSVIGHAAWALMVYEECGSSDVDFISMSPARNIKLPGIERIMAPVSARVPIHVTFVCKDMTTGGLLKTIGYQLLSMVGVEHYAVRALRGKGFNWNSQLLEWRKVDHLIERFTILFTLIVNRHGETVDELIGHCNRVKGEATGFNSSLSTLRDSSTEFEGFSI